MPRRMGLAMLFRRGLRAPSTRLERAQARLTKDGPGEERLGEAKEKPRMQEVEPLQAGMR